MIERWLLVLIAVLLAADAYYTRLWLRESRRALEELKDQAARIRDAGKGA